MVHPKSQYCGVDHIRPAESRGEPGANVAGGGHRSGDAVRAVTVGCSWPRKLRGVRQHTRTREDRQLSPEGKADVPALLVLVQFVWADGQAISTRFALAQRPFTT